MTTDPVYDADQHGAAQQEMGTTARASIVKTLTKSIRLLSARFLSLPYVSYRSGAPRLAAMPINEVVQEYGTEAKPMDAWLAVLKDSDCPLVEAFRQELARSYADAHADDIDGYGSEE